MKFCIILIILLFVSCNSLKIAESDLKKGNYDATITRVVKKLPKETSNVKRKIYITLLETAFKKAVERDLQILRDLQLDRNPETLVKQYDLYLTLRKRQQTIQPLLPLLGASFHFTNYAQPIANTKHKLVTYLYHKYAPIILRNNLDKIVYQQAYNTLSYVNTLHPNFKDLPNLMVIAQKKGTMYALLVFNNKTREMIPFQLKDEITRINTHDLDSKWLIFNHYKNSKAKYDYIVEVQLNDITQVPQKVTSRTFQQQKKIESSIVDVNSIRKKKYTITAFLTEHTQYKCLELEAQVFLKNTHKNQADRLLSFNEKEAFKNSYATFIGNKEAIEKEYLKLLQNSYVPYPRNYTMYMNIAKKLRKQLRYSLVNYFKK